MSLVASLLYVFSALNYLVRHVCSLRVYKITHKNFWIWALEWGMGQEVRTAQELEVHLYSVLSISHPRQLCQHADNAPSTWQCWACAQILCR